MSRRIFLMLAIGVVLLGTMRAAIWYFRPKSLAEQRAQEMAESRRQLAKQMRIDLKHAIATAQDAEAKKEYEFEYRLFDHMDATGEMASLVETKDGIDEFEAFVIARQYFGSVFGSCGSLALPERRYNRWVVAISVGRLGPSGPPIEIDCRSGVVSCTGHPTVQDVESFVKHPVLMPNQSLEPTSLAVTPRADARVAPAKDVAHH